MLARHSGRRRQAAHLGTFNEPSTTGCRFSCSRTSPTATASFSSRASPNRVSIRCAHLPLHAHRRGAPHVRGRDRRGSCSEAHAGGHERARQRRSCRGPCTGCSRSADHPALHEFLVHLFAGICSVPKSLPTPPVPSPTASRAGRTKRSSRTNICSEASYELETPQGKEAVSLRNAMNEVLRNAYIKDCEIGVKRWNMQISRAGFDFQLRLPSPRFRRPSAPGQTHRPIRRARPSAARNSSATWRDGFRAKTIARS